MMNQKDSVSDKALIEAIQKGDRNAAASLYNRHIDRVNRICYRIVLDGAQVQDCVQEVWLKVFRNLDRFRCRQSFIAWLNTVTANTAIDYYRKWIKKGNRPNTDKTHMRAVAVERTTDQQLDNALIHQRVHESLEEMSVNQRTALVLRYFEDMSTAEIARTLGCTKGTVRTHIRRSLLALRAKLNGKSI
ncbi:MAG: RNA polymerase sigma factor [Planctomycetota bacterium]|jgi:RNA polymerase sigma-70 factor (ECF subfamily)